MKTLKISALALMTATAPVLAETHMSEDYTNLIRTRDITDGNIYTTNEAHDEGSWMSMEYNEVGADWNEIGEIEDIILDRNGQMIGIVAEVGGFLDIGDKHVLIKVDEVKLVPVDDRTYNMVTRLSEEELEARPSVDEGWWD